MFCDRKANIGRIKILYLTAIRHFLVFTIKNSYAALFVNIIFLIKIDNKMINSQQLS